MSHLHGANYDDLDMEPGVRVYMPPDADDPLQHVERAVKTNTGLDLGSCLLIPVGSDPEAIALLLKRALPVASWVRLVQVVLDMRVG